MKKAKIISIDKKSRSLEKAIEVPTKQSKKHITRSLQKIYFDSLKKIDDLLDDKLIQDGN